MCYGRIYRTLHISSSYEVLAFDLRALADLLASYQFRSAYNNRDWSGLPDSAKKAMDAYVKLLQEVYKTQTLSFRTQVS